MKLVYGMKKFGDHCCKAQYKAKKTFKYNVSTKMHNSEVPSANNEIHFVFKMRLTNIEVPSALLTPHTHPFVLIDPLE